MQRIVLKVGTHVLSENGKLCDSRMGALCDFIAELMKENEIILVSSAAIVAGFSKLNLDKNILSNRQALAAIGQPVLLETYSSFFQKKGILTGQILLSAQDFDSRKSTQKAKDVIEALIDNSVLPIINENDATATDEIVFGDNDQLSAHVAYYFDANLLVILSDINGYYNKDPRKFKDAKIKKVVTKIDKNELETPQVGGSEFATGGIVTKLKAANFLLEKHIDMFMCSGFDLSDAKEFLLHNNHAQGTLFTCKEVL